MERTLNISGSFFAPNVKNETSALELMKSLAARGFKLIISTTTAHGNAAKIAAELYPNITFVMSGGTTTLPNLSSINWSGPDQYYAAGVFAGANTIKNKVGFVHPGPPVSMYTTLNAFYLGVKSINPNCDVLTVFTDSYLDPDRTVGACKRLLDAGVDMLLGQQDDLTLQDQAMAAGFLAVGTNGYSLRDIYGESIGVSVIRNWGGPFTTYANESLKGVFKRDISGAFATGYTSLDTPSHLVPPKVWEEVQRGVQALKGKTKPYFCTPLVRELGIDPNTSCLFNNTKLAVSLLTDIKNLGTYHVPLETVPVAKSTHIAIIVVASFLYVATATVAIAIFTLRRDTVMLAGSPVFLGLVLIGIALCFTAAIVWVSEPTKHICASRIWLPSVGFTLCMGAMIIKNVRLMIIFDAQMRRVRIRDSKLLIWVSILLAVDVVLLAVWNGVGNPFVYVQQGIEGLGTYQIRNICSSKQVGEHILYAIVSWHIAQLAVGCFVTFKIRVIDIEEFNESRPFGLSIYIVSLVTIIAGILVGAGGTTYVQQTTILSLSFLIGSCAVLFLLFAPKFLTIIMKGSRSLDNFLSSELNQKRGGGSSTRSSGRSSSTMSKSHGLSSSSVETIEAKEKEVDNTPPPKNVDAAAVV